MFDAIGGAMKWLFKGLCFGLLLIFVLMQSGVQAIAESDIDASQVNVSQPQYSMKVVSSFVDVSTTASVTTQKPITDFSATLTLYDCPSANSNVTNCTPLGQQFYEFDGTNDAIDPGERFVFDHKYSFYNVRAKGVFVPVVEFTGFQG